MAASKSCSTLDHQNSRHGVDITGNSSQLSRYLNWYFQFKSVEFATVEDFHDFNRERGPTKFFLLLWFTICTVIFPAALYIAAVHVSRIVITNDIFSSSRFHSIAALKLSITVVCEFINVFISITLFICGYQLIAHYHGWPLINFPNCNHTFQSGFRLVCSLPSIAHDVFCRRVAPNLLSQPENSMSLSVSFERTSIEQSMSISNHGCQRQVPGQRHPGKNSTRTASQRVEIAVLREFSSGNSVRIPASSNLSPARKQNMPSYFAIVPASPNSFSGDGNTSFSPAPLPQTIKTPSRQSTVKLLNSSIKTSKVFPTPSLSKGSISVVQKDIESGGDTIGSDEYSIGPKIGKWNLIIFVLVEVFILSLFVQQGIGLDCQSSIDNGSVSLLPSVLTGIHTCDSPPSYFILCYASMLLLLPYLMFVALQDISIGWVWLILTISYLSIFAMCIFMLDPAHFGQLILVTSLFLTFVVTMVIDAQVHKVQMFLTTRKLGGILEENERMALHNHAQEMRHMIANVAHDLKTPLASFLTGLEYIQMVIEEDWHSSGCSSGNLASISNCVSNMRDTHSFMLMTINRCIDYTKASKGLRLIPKYETIDLRDALELPMTCMKNMQQKIEIVLNPLPANLCRCAITDKQWLQENVLCLLSNAVKYSAEGTVTIGVSIEEYLVKSCASPSTPIESLHHKKQHVSEEETNINPSPQQVTNESFQEVQTELMPFLRIEVEDTGIGMSEDAMSSLFNPFKQTQRLAGGTGLGLYSLAKRIEALHGFYGVMKRRDGQQGSLFWFAIPYKPDAIYAQQISSLTSKIPEESNCAPTQNDYPLSEEDDKIVTATVPLEHPVSTQSLVKSDIAVVDQSQPPIKTSLNILVVDDSLTILKMSTLMLKKLGHEVTTADNGAIAAKLVQERLVDSHSCGFDVILMDLQMPVMDGLEATRRIREMESEFNSDKNSDPSPPMWRRERQIIVGMSANSDHETAANAYQVGVDAFLSKPFRIETFRSTIEKLLSEKMQ